VVETRKQEIITAIQQIQKKFTVQDFENKFVSTLKHYLNNIESVSYYDMRSQLDMEFNTDMSPLFMYIINTVSLPSYPDISVYKYIKVIEKIKLQFGSTLHIKHEASVNPQPTERITDKATNKRVPELFCIN
jgi:hypothetical protein